MAQSALNVGMLSCKFKSRIKVQKVAVYMCY